MLSKTAQNRAKKSYIVTTTDMSNIQTTNIQTIRSSNCEFCKISKNTFFTEHLWQTAFGPCGYYVLMVLK